MFWSFGPQMFWSFLFLFQVSSFPGGSVVKNPPANAGDGGSIPGSGRSPGEENGNSLQHSCLGNPMKKELGGLQFIGSKRVRHDLASKQLQEFPSQIHERRHYCLFLKFSSIRSQAPLTLERRIPRLLLGHLLLFIFPCSLLPLLTPWSCGWVCGF